MTWIRIPAGVIAERRHGWMPDSGAPRRVRLRRSFRASDEGAVRAGGAEARPGDTMRASSASTLGEEGVGEPQHPPPRSSRLATACVEDDRLGDHRRLTEDEALEQGVAEDDPDLARAEVEEEDAALVHERERVELARPRVRELRRAFGNPSLDGVVLAGVEGELRAGERRPHERVQVVVPHPRAGRHDAAPDDDGVVEARADDRLSLRTPAASRRELEPYGNVAREGRAVSVGSGQSSRSTKVRAARAIGQCSG